MWANAQVKVARFLQLKKQGQHVNTSLLRSSSFANPTIYAKLVEFVDIDERASAFPRGGWLTRRGLEDTKKDYGPQVLLRRQDELAEAARRAQRDRKEISFTGAKTRDRRERERDSRRERDREGRRREDRDRERGGLSRPRQTGWMARR